MRPRFQKCHNSKFYYHMIINYIQPETSFIQLLNGAILVSTCPIVAEMLENASYGTPKKGTLPQGRCMRPIYVCMG
jgi:hypothetical protein